MNRLGGKVAIIAGASGGIGSETARAFVREGAKVMLADFNTQGVVKLTQDIGSAADHFHLDATDEDSWKSLVAATQARFGRLDVLINAVGVSAVGSVEQESLEQWHRVFAINTDSVFLGLKHAIPAMAAQGGSIVNFSSTVAIRQQPEAAAYGASKAAVRALTQSAALYCGKSRNGVRVNCLAPGAVQTQMVDDMINGLVHAGAVADYSAGQALFASLHPIGRIGTPSEIAATLVFLSSDEASFITGDTIAVDGGFLVA